jgi:hypothetical protein
MIQIDQMNTKIKDIDTWINSPETQEQLVRVDEAQSRSDKVVQYKDQIQIASDNYITKPKLSWDVFQTILDNEYGEDTELDATVTAISYSGGTWNLSCESEDSYGPSRFIANLYEQDIFREIKYSGYAIAGSETTAEDGTVISSDMMYTFTTSFVMEPNLTPAEEEAEAIRIAEEEAAALAEAEANGNADETVPENNEEVVA